MSSRQAKFQELEKIKNEMIKNFNLPTIVKKDEINPVLVKEDLSYLEKGKLSSLDLSKIKTNYCDIS